MVELENQLSLKNLSKAKPYLVPYVFTERYFDILKTRLQNKKLSYNERHYYNHFIKKKLQGMFKLFDITDKVQGKEFIREDRLKKVIALLKKYTRKHKNMKILISGSFLYNKRYNDIDIFILSKYNKEDYRDGLIHINYLPLDVEKTIFFKSIYSISVANFKSEEEIKEKFMVEDILNYYELVILLLIQKDDYIRELRDLIIMAEYISNRVVLNSMQLKITVDKIINSKNTIEVINKYILTKLVGSYDVAVLKKTLKQFLEKNSKPEKGQKLYENWKIYNKTYREVLKVVT
ncbi:MAG: hypothetical protein AABX29_04555 [Nanoarchaeota archaeon]